mgnify:CR=1 FL=1
MQKKDFITRRIVKLIQNDISYYAMHTNYDVLGMAELAGKVLDIAHTDVLDVTQTDEVGEEKGIGRLGEMPETMTLEECCVYVKHKLELGSLKVFGDMNRPVRRLAILPGSGKSGIPVALAIGRCSKLTKSFVIACPQCIVPHLLSYGKC